MASQYQQTIHEIDPTVNPVGIECLMRLEYHTLDHLPRSKFAEEIELAKVMFLQNPEKLRQAAESYSMGQDYDRWELQLRQTETEPAPATAAAPREIRKSMEYLSTTVSNPTKGQCASCAEPNVTLEAVIVSLTHHPTNRNAMNQPTIVASNAHLICGECTRTHPIWKFREETNPEIKTPAAAPSA